MTEQNSRVLKELGREKIQCEGHGFTPNGGTTAMNKVLTFMKVQ